MTDTMTTTDTFARYHLLGRTGLRVSPLALGAMTFGQEGWGADEETSRAIFRRYLEAGGNFVDTANNYGNGRSEELLGTFLRGQARDRLVLATKFTGALAPGDPNAAGNGRKNMLASLDASLRRLQTDYVDLYWLHAWDTVTPVEEVMSTFASRSFAPMSMASAFTSFMNADGDRGPCRSCSRTAGPTRSGAC